MQLVGPASCIRTQDVPGRNLRVGGAASCRARENSRTNGCATAGP